MSAGEPTERMRVGLCVDCAHARRLVSAKDSVFYRCRRAERDPRFREYPQLPVRECGGFDGTPLGRDEPGTPPSRDR